MSQSQPNASSWSPSLASPSWVDAPPPRLTYEQQRTMREAFESNYPGEILDEDSLPGQRLWASIYQMLKAENKVRWLPWTQILSSKMESQILEAKATRTARSETLSLSAMLFEEAPQVPEADLRSSPWKVSQILTIRRNAFALCGACHLSNAKALDHKFVSMLSKQYSDDSGLRGPNLKEAIEADRHVCEEIYRLVNDHS